MFISLFIILGLFGAVFAFIMAFIIAYEEYHHHYYGIDLYKASFSIALMAFIVILTMMIVSGIIISYILKQ